MPTGSAPKAPDAICSCRNRACRANWCGNYDDCWRVRIIQALRTSSMKCCERSWRRTVSTQAALAFDARQAGPTRMRLELGAPILKRMHTAACDRGGAELAGFAAASIVLPEEYARPCD